MNIGTPRKSTAQGGKSLPTGRYIWDRLELIHVVQKSVTLRHVTNMLPTYPAKLWMCIYKSHYNVTAALIGQAFGLTHTSVSNKGVNHSIVPELRL